MNGFSLWLYEMRAALRRPAPLFLSFFIPILVIALGAVSVYRLVPTDGETIKAAIVDHDQTFETETLINQLAKDEEMKKSLTLHPMPFQEAEDQFEKGELAGIITIPEGFSDSLRFGENEPIQVVTNEDQPLSSNMLELLLDSGAKYISASQSAVNTVYDLHIKQLEDNSERNQKLQQSILTYTLFALSRNDAFEQDELQSGSRIGWRSHILLAIFFTLISGFSILFQWLEERSNSKSMRLRLRSFHITAIQLWRVQWGKWFFFISFAGVLYWSGGLWIGEPLPRESILITVVIGMFMASLLTCLNSMVSHAGIRIGILMVVAFVGLGAGGVWVPSLYLPQYLETGWNPFSALYLLFAENIMGDALSIGVLLKVGLWIFGFVGVGLIAARREERRHAYVSSFKRS